MGGLAKSHKDCRTNIYNVQDKKDFVAQFNRDFPPKDFFDSYRKAGELFNVYGSAKQRS